MLEAPFDTALGGLGDDVRDAIPRVVSYKQGGVLTVPQVTAVISASRWRFTRTGFL